MTNFIINYIASRSNQKFRNLMFKLIGFCNKDIQIRKGCYFQSTSQIFFGKNIFINKNNKFYNGYGQNKAKIVIRDNVTIGFDNIFVTTSHDIGNEIQRANYKDYFCKPIIIDEGVWITTNCTILPGVHIGKGCVIAAGSVVNKDCEPNHLYAGVPAVKIKRLS